MSEAFHHVLFPGSCSVLGRKLPPLSLWSFSVLQAVESPFLSLDGESRFTLADLQIAVRCALSQPHQPPDLRPGFRDRWLWRFKHKNRVYLDCEAGKFTAWLIAHQRLPSLWHNETSEPRFLSAPLVLTQVAALMQLGMTHSEAWACSPGYARWLILANDERTSEGVRFTEDEEDEIEIAEELTEEEARAQALADLGEKRFADWLKARTERNAS